MRKPLLVLLVLTLVGLLVSRRGTAESQPVEKTASVEIPVRLYGGFLILVKGRIGTRDDLNFVLDTGVTHTTLDSRLAVALQLPPSGALKKKIISFDASLAPKWADLADLQFGLIQVPKLTVVVGDLGYLQSLGTHVDVLIGLDVLGKTSFTIDYSKERIAFGPSLMPISRKKVFHAPLHSTPACLLVDLQAGDQTLHVIVDTGAAGVVLYEDHLVDHAIAYRVIGSAMGRSVGGAFESSFAILPPLAVGGRAVKRQVFLTRSPSGIALRDVDGFLGLASLHAHRVSFDFLAHTLTWSD